MGMGSGHNKTAALSMYLSLLVKDKDGDEVPIAPGLAYNKHPNVLFFFFNLLSDHLLATM